MTQVMIAKLGESSSVRMMQQEIAAGNRRYIAFTTAAVAAVQQSIQP